MLTPEKLALLRQGCVIPALPLALNAERRLDERREQALLRYYADAGAGGLAVAVHTTQFEIREPQHALFAPVLRLAAHTLDDWLDRPFLRVAGICGDTAQARAEAALARELGYDLALLSLAALADRDRSELLTHCRAVGDILPLVGFYLQPAVGGRVLPYAFWRGFFEIPAVQAVKIAPFNRYQTFDVVRALAESGREDVVLYTGNDDNIVLDLLTEYVVGDRRLRLRGGLLGHWACWTRTAVELLAEVRQVADSGGSVPPELLTRAVQITDSNAAFFDAANGFRGCIAGIHEVLRRQGLLAGIWCLDPAATLSPGQAAEIDRVCTAYPHLNDDAFVAANLERWLA